MPNWCDNYIKIKGRREEIIKCIEGMKGKRAVYKEEMESKDKLEETYTFNKAVKIPEEVLEMGYEKAGYSWQKRNWGCKWDILYESKYELDMILKELTCVNKKENGRSNRSAFRAMYNENSYYEEKENYYKSNSLKKDKSHYERENFNKYDIKEVEFFVMSPWNPVDKWVRALSKKHSELEFELRFEISEEGFKGKMIFEVGELVDKC